MFKFFEYLFSIPKSFYVSFRLLGFINALKLPILCRFNVKLQSLKGRVIVCDGPIVFSMMRIGFGNVGIFDKSTDRTILEINGDVYVRSGKKSVFFGLGSRLCVTKNANLYLGHNFKNTAMGTIVCAKHITFGDNVLTSWNTLVMDTDWHAIKNIDSGDLFSIAKPINVGNNVWICTRAVLLKGTVVPDGCVVGANSLVTQKFDCNNSIIAGNPAKIIRKNIEYLE